MGRDALRLRHAQAGRGRERGRAHRILPRAPRPLQGTEDRRLRTIAQDLDRKDPEIRAAGAGKDARLSTRTDGLDIRILTVLVYPGASTEWRSSPSWTARPPVRAG